MQIVERAATEQDMDFEQPMRKVREGFPLNRMKVDVKKFRGEEGKQWACRIKVDGEVVALVKGCSCDAEAESRAGEAVLANLREEKIQQRAEAAIEDGGQKTKRE